MTHVFLVRHGRTPWNDDKRIQGHTDIPLNDDGRAELSALRVPSEYKSWPVHASPLQRAVETARLLQLKSPLLDPRLKEMHYGEWEGTTWAELEVRYGDALAVRARRGLEFRPDGGESPAELKLRLTSWLDDVRSQGRDTVAVTHKGVIRMALAMATGWDLVSKAPAKLRWDCGHLFTLSANERCAIEVAALNVALVSP
jgi:probable phosphoglycerate mutase